jgi:LysM repeat protein
MNNETQQEESYVERRIQQEQEPRPITFKSSFWIVLAIHIFGGIGLMSFTGGTKTANAEDKKFLETKEAKFVGIEQPTPTPTPTPQATPVLVEKVKLSKNDWPKANGKPNIVKPKYTKEYIVKKGDNLYSISKRYKLSFEKLKEINNIKDPSKIVVGQKLKFL